MEAVPKDTVTRATEVLEIAHTDVVGPIANKSPEKFKNACGFVDSFSRFIKVYFMRRRVEVLEKNSAFLFWYKKSTHGCQWWRKRVSDHSVVSVEQDTKHRHSVLRRRMGKLEVSGEQWLERQDEL